MTSRRPFRLLLGLFLLPASLLTQQVRGPTLGGYVQLRETYEQVIGLTGDVINARVYLDGAVPHNFSYRVSVSLQKSTSLADAYVLWTPTGAWAITVGQFKTPFGRQFLVSRGRVEFADRAAVSESLPPRRDIGIMAGYALRRAATASIGVFNGEGANSIANTDSSVLAIARITVHPFTVLDLGMNVAAYGGDSTRYGTDGELVSGPLKARAEVIGQHRSGTASGENDVGWYVEAMYHVQPTLQLMLRQEDLRRPQAQPREIATTAAAKLESSDHHVALTVEYKSRALDGVRRGSALGQLQLSF